MLQNDVNNTKWIIGASSAIRESEIKIIDIKYKEETTGFKFVAIANLFDGRSLFLIGADDKKALVSNLNEIMNGYRENI